MNNSEVILPFLDKWYVDKEMSLSNISLDVDHNLEEKFVQNKHISSSLVREQLDAVQTIETYNSTGDIGDSHYHNGLC